MPRRERAADGRRVSAETFCLGTVGSCQPGSKSDAYDAAEADDLLMYGLPDSFSLPSFCDATLISVQIGQYQVSLGFDGNNRGVSIESRYTVEAADGEAKEFNEPPAGAAALV